MLHYHTHKIGLYSPLLSQLGLAHRFLSGLQNASCDGIYPILVPEWERFESEKVYQSELISDATTLAHFPQPVHEDIMHKAWDCVVRVSGDLYSSHKRLGEGEEIRWPSVYHHGERKFAEFPEIHCPECTRMLTSFLQKVGDSNPDSSDFDSIAHGDVHGGNLILTGSLFYAIDLENCHSAPAFADIFLFSLLNRGAAPWLKEMLDRHSQVVYRQPRLEVDFRHSLSIMLIQYVRAVGIERENVGEALHQTLQIFHGELAS
jgi:hypothetical protein